MHNPYSIIKSFRNNTLGKTFFKKTKNILKVPVRKTGTK